MWVSCWTVGQASGTLPGARLFSGRPGRRSGADAGPRATQDHRPAGRLASRCLDPRPLVFGVALGTAASGNQFALYTQAPAEQLGVASGLFRTFGYVGSIAASAITGIVFHNAVSDSGVHLIALVMVGVSILAVVLTLLDHDLRSPGRLARHR